ncbi:S-adenosyl-L-methionine-dependent methyltransferase [Umbelopsis sp. PMI_123]|nr:S-adenosyl-L-methionine-dependent methyltransferase [Umbelopsis sp. PMI_123]
MSSIHILENQPFLTFLSGVLDSHFFAKGHSEPLRLLEVGCGPGHFARLLSSHYGSKVKIIGLDANEHVLTTAKELSDGLVEGSVTYVQGDFNKYSDDVPYDVIVFTKSFHHCLPIDEAAENAKKLLKSNGLVIAEELVRDFPTEYTIKWFYERFDPLVASKQVDPIETLSTRHFGPDPRKDKHVEQHGEGESKEHGNHGHGHGHNHGGPEAHLKRMEQFCDPSLPPVDRWKTFYKFTEGLPVKKETIDAIVKAFGSANTRVTDNLPFLYHHLTFCGQDNEEGRAVVTKMIVEEEKAVVSGELSALGMNIVAEKVE